MSLVESAVRRFSRKRNATDNVKSLVCRCFLLFRSRDAFIFECDDSLRIKQRRDAAATASPSHFAFESAEQLLREPVEILLPFVEVMTMRGHVPDMFDSMHFRM